MAQYTRDERIMRRVIGLAERANGAVSPNPLVGCVIYNQGKKIGEGFHEKFGGPHAEVNAIGSVKNVSDLKGAELFVNLEPCCHFGKTPPCTNLIIESGIGRVVIAQQDPFEEVKGKGIQQLKEAGIEVVVGVLEEDAKKLNHSFNYANQVQKPFVTIKLAATVDGRMSTKNGHSQWITNEMARLDVHRGRYTQDVILTGIGTIKADNPKLNIRLSDRQKDIPVAILDSELQIPLDAMVFSYHHPENILIFHSHSADRQKIIQIDNAGFKRYEISEDRSGNLDIAMVYNTLFQMGLHKIWIEAGPKLISSVIDQHGFNQLIIYTGPFLTGSGPVFYESETHRQWITDSLKLQALATEFIGDTIKTTYLKMED